MNQLSLNIPTAYEPELNHPARYINQLVEGLAIRKPNIMGDQGNTIRECY